MTQAILEIVFMLTIATFLGYKIGVLLERRRGRQLNQLYDRQAKKLEELTFDLNHCIQVRRRVQSQLYQLRKKQEAQEEAAPTVVDGQGKIKTATHPKKE